MYVEYPIFKKALFLNTYLEDIVRHFSKYHKYTIGSELREKAREVMYQIYRVYYERDKKESLILLRNRIEEVKITLFIAKEIGAFNNLKQFEISSRAAFELTKQAQGWLRSLK